jgi:hypothetical protein
MSSAFRGPAYCVGRRLRFGRCGRAGTGTTGAMSTGAMAQSGVRTASSREIYTCDRTFAFRRCALTIGIAAALLAGCATQRLGDTPPPAADAGFEAVAPSGAIAGTTPRFVAEPKRPDHRASWILTDAKRVWRLLYISDWSTNDVFIYDYDKGMLEGQITGLNDPYGQCVDKKGNVWVVAFGGSSVSEFAHGGTQAVETLTTGYQPKGCSVDPTTGNLAVAGEERVDVFVHARGKAHVYQSAVCYPFWAPGYDGAGNLYVEALLYGSAKPLQGYSDPLACELRHGGTSLRAVHLSGFGIYNPASVTWDGKHLTLSDQDYLDNNETAIDRVSEDASGNLTLIGQTILTDDCDGNDVEVPQPFIVGKTVVGGNLRCSYYGSQAKFDYWPYPAGGNPTRSLQSPPDKPVGQSVSIAR